MPDNRVVFELGAEPWTLAGLCLVLGLGLVLLGGSLMAVLLIRHGRARRLDAQEASRVAFNADRLGEVRPIHGPAAGVEVRVSFSIGDLRRAREAGNRFVFWGVPGLLVAWSGGFGLLVSAAALWTGEGVLLAGHLVTVPLCAFGCFMPWAAVHTQLE